DGLVGRGGVGRSHGEEGAGHARQLTAGAFHGLDGVLEGRRGRVLRDGLALFARLGDCPVEGRLIVLGTDDVVRRHAVGRAPRTDQRIRRLRGGRRTGLGGAGEARGHQGGGDGSGKNAGT